MVQNHGGFSSLNAQELQYKLQRFFAQKGPPPLEAGPSWRSALAMAMDVEGTNLLTSWYMLVWMLPKVWWRWYKLTYQLRLSRTAVGSLLESPVRWRFLQEVFISTQNLTVEVQETIMKDCPGLLISASFGNGHPRGIDGHMTYVFFFFLRGPWANPSISEMLRKQILHQSSPLPLLI